jgi:transcriptional regulator with XRE-family HTH domain
VERVAAWQASGLSQREYAKRAGVNASTLAWWHSKLREPQGKPRQRRRRGKASPVSFLEVKPEGVAPEGAAGGIELELSELRIRLPDGLDGVRLARVLQAVRTRR